MASTWRLAWVPSRKRWARSWRNRSQSFLQNRTPGNNFTCKYAKVQSKIEIRKSDWAHNKSVNGGIAFSGTIRSSCARGALRGMSNSFMQEAIQRAVENVRSGRGGPFGAVVVKDGRIISTGTN